MIDIVKLLLGGKSVDVALREDAEAIKRIGADSRVFTFDERQEGGVITARSRPIPVEELQRELPAK